MIARQTYCMVHARNAIGVTGPGCASRDSRAEFGRMGLKKKSEFRKSRTVPAYTDIAHLVFRSRFPPQTDLVLQVLRNQNYDSKWLCILQASALRTLLAYKVARITRTNLQTIDSARYTIKQITTPPAQQGITEYPLIRSSRQST